MRRRLSLIYYIAIALSVCGFGALAFVQPYLKSFGQTAAAQTIERKTSVARPEITKTKQKHLADESENDEEKAAFEVLQPTIGKWLRGARIKSELTEASNESIRKIIGKNKSELDEGELRWLSYFRFEPTLIDAGGDGKKEPAIRNNCAPVGNCQFWLFEKRGKGYRILLKTLPGAVQTFELKPSKTKGYFDLETKDHDDAWSGGIALYKFDGASYKARECFKYSSSEYRDGRIFEFKSPQITRRKCDE